MMIEQQPRRSIHPLVATTCIQPVPPPIASIFGLHHTGRTTGGPELQRPMSLRVAETPQLLGRVPMALPVPVALTTIIVPMVFTVLAPMASPALLVPLASTVLMTLTEIFVPKGLVRRP